MTFDERIREFQNIYENTGKAYFASLLIPDVYEDSYFKEKKPQQKFYTCRTYNRIKSISVSDVYDTLNILVKKNVSKMPIFTYVKRKEKFIEDNKDKVEAELKHKLEISENTKQKEFEENELSIKAEKDEMYKKEYEAALAEYNNFFDPSQEWLQDKFKEYSKYIHDIKWKKIFPLCSGSMVFVEKDSTGKNRYTCSVLVDNMNEYFDNNLYKYSITSAGNLSKRQKTDKELEEEYAQNVCAMAFICAVMVFNICFDAKEVLVSADIKYIDRTTGNEQDRYLYSVIVPRDLVKTYKMENLDSVAALLSLEGNADIRKGREIYFVEPLSWRLDQDADVSINDSNAIFIDYRKFGNEIFNQKQYETLTNAMNSKLETFANVIKEKVIEFNMFDNEEDINTFINGLKAFIVLLVILEEEHDSDIFCKENSKKLEELFSHYFDKKVDSIEEFKKLTENNAFELIERDESPMDPFTTFIIKAFVFHMFEDQEDEIDDDSDKGDFNEENIRIDLD